MSTSNEERILKIKDPEVTEKGRLNVNPRLSSCRSPLCILRKACLRYKNTEFCPNYSYLNNSAPKIKSSCFVPNKFPSGFCVDELDEEVYEYYLTKIIDTYDYI